jgi:arylsulfatase A-like enzyme
MHRTLRLLPPALGLVALLCALLPPPTAADPIGAPRPAPVKLAVLVVFDQMRADYLTRWDDLFVEDGFHRLEQDGAWFQDCHYPYAHTVTSAGHASLATGCSPSVHGIVNNGWFDRGENADVYAVGAPKGAAYTRTPERLLAPTLGDALKKARPKARVVSVSLKDRAAVLMAGRDPSHMVYWHDSDDRDKEGTLGTFVTSRYYKDAPERPWAKAVGRERADAWLGKTWAPLYADLDYAARCGSRDDWPGKSRGYHGKQGSAFPHAMGESGKGNKEYYEILHTSPYGSELLLDLVRGAVEGEKLGRNDDAPDLLCVSFSSTDLVGHYWGPDSPEELDMILRSDLIVRDLLALLDDKVGKGNYLLCLSADHGVCPLPRATRAPEKQWGDLTAPAEIVGDAAKFLGGLATAEGTAAPLQGDPDNFINWCCVNPAWLKENKLEAAAVADKLADHLRGRKDLAAVYTRDQLRAAPKDDPVAEKLRRSFHPDRCGDVVVVPKPYCLILDTKKGYQTSHGTPYDYDTHVPLLVYGPGVRPGVRKERESPLSAAAILARGLGIDPPEKAEGAVPEKLFTATTAP